MTKCYYAHCVAIYNTAQEQRDIVTLRTLGLEVYNPNNPEVDAAVRAMKASGNDDYMDYFKNLVEACDVFAFRALPDGRIPAGVALELMTAMKHKMQVLELPNGVLGRMMSVDATREYLRDVGQR